MSNYLIAWTVTWCVGSILVAPWGYNPVNTGISETGIWRMLYVSPLPFLLALGLETCVQFFGSSRPLDAAPSWIRHGETLLASLPFLAIGGGLFILWDAAIRSVLVGLALILMLGLMIRFRGQHISKTLLVLIIVLIVVNAAFRSLFPLLLDPHNLFNVTQ